LKEGGGERAFRNDSMKIIGKEARRSTGLPDCLRSQRTGGSFSSDVYIIKNLQNCSQHL
jgi:hypothetical protein